MCANIVSLLDEVCWLCCIEAKDILSLSVRELHFIFETE